MKKLLAVLLLLASPLLAQDVKISNLTSGSPVQATDMIPIARGGANFRLAGSDFLSSAGGATGCTTPPFSFTADTNAGMCISAANQLALQTGASNPRGVLSLAYAAANPNVFLQAISSGGVQSGFYAEDPDAGPPEASVYVGGVKKFVFSSSAGLTLGGSGTGYHGLGFYPPSQGAGPFNGYFTSADLTADRTWTMPNATGDVPVLASSGIFVRTAAQTFAARSIAAGTGISVSNGDGVSGNPTVSLDITGLTAEPVIQPMDDALPFYDASAAANRKILWSDLVGAVGRDFWMKEEDFILTDESPTLCNGAVDNAGTQSVQLTLGGRMLVFTAGTGTNSNGASGCIDTFAFTGSPNITPGLGRIRIRQWVRLEDLSDGTDTYTLVAGWGTSAFAHDATPTDGAVFTYTDSVNSGKWRGVCYEDSSATNVDDTGSAVAADTWYRLDVEINADASSAEFFVDGTSIGTCASNVPDTNDPVGVQFSIVKSAGTTARTAYIDAVRIFGELATAR